MTRQTASLIGYGIIALSVLVCGAILVGRLLEPVPRRPMPERPATRPEPAAARRPAPAETRRREEPAPAVVDHGDSYIGRVELLGGDPVVGIRVILASVDDRHPDWSGLDRLDWFDGSVLVVFASTRSDRSGRFELLPPWSADRSPPDPLFVATSSPRGYVAERLMAPEPGREIVFVLRPGGVLEGVVRARENGLPVPGVDVRVASTVFGPEGFEQDVDDIRTDRNGRFRMEEFIGLPTEFRVRVGSDEEFETVLGEVAAVEPGETVEVELLVRIAPFVAGRVVDAVSFEPLPGASLSLEHAGHTESDDQGRFLVPRVETRGKRPGALLKAHKSGYLLIERWVQFDTTESWALSLALARGTRIEGKVIDCEGRPTEAQVRLSWGGRTLGRVQADRSGRFAMDQLPPVTGARLSGLITNGKPNRPVGHALLDDLDLTRDRSDQILRADDRCTASLTLLPPPDVRAWPDASTPGQMPVSFIRRIDPPGPGRHASWSKDGINIRFERLSAGTYLATSRRRNCGAFVTLAAGEKATVQLMPIDRIKGNVPAWISGRVVDAEGRPLPEATVIIEPWGRLLGPAECPWLDQRPGTFEAQVVWGAPITVIGRLGSVETRVKLDVEPLSVRAIGDLVLGAPGD